MLKIGDEVTLRPQTFGNGVMPGKVVYIHPEGRWAMVDFTVQHKAPWWIKKPPVHIRECFLLVDRKRMAHDVPRGGHHSNLRSVI